MAAPKRSLVNNHQISIRMPRKLHADLVKLAKGDRRTVTSLIVKVCSDYVDSAKKGAK